MPDGRAGVDVRAAAVDRLCQPRDGADLPGHLDKALVVDPIVQALTLTDVVVEATVVALLLGLVVQASKRFGSIDPDGIVRMRD